MTELRRGILRGVAWNGLAQAGNQAINLGVMVVLTRILPASTFGLVAMAGVFTGFFSLFPGLGLGAALVQKEDAEERHFVSVFWVNAGLSLALAALVALMGPVGAWFFDEPALVGILGALAVQFPITAIGAISRVRLRRDMRFDVLSRVEIVAGASGGVVGVALALLGAGVWSLVARSLITATLSSLLVSVARPFLPAFRVDRAAVRECSGFGANLVGRELLVYLFRNFDNLLVGKYLGAIALGVYTRAYAFMLVPLLGATQVVSGVLFPALSRVQEDDARVRGVMLRVCGAIALVVYPAAAWFVVAADPFVRVVLGERWEGVATLLRIMCPAALWECFGGVGSAIYRAKGRADLHLRVTAASYLFSAVAFVAGLQLGIEGVAAAYLVASAGIELPSLHFARRLVGLRLGTMVAHLARLSALVAVSAVVSALVLAYTAQWAGPTVQLLAVTAVFALCYVALVLAVKPAPYRDVRALLASRGAPGAGTAGP